LLSARSERPVIVGSNDAANEDNNSAFCCLPGGCPHSKAKVPQYRQASHYPPESLVLRLYSEGGQPRGIGGA
jgi:hypothetical protein